MVNKQEEKAFNPRPIPKSTGGPLQRILFWKNILESKMLMKADVYLLMFLLGISGKWFSSLSLCVDPANTAPPQCRIGRSQLPIFVSFESFLAVTQVIVWIFKQGDVISFVIVIFINYYCLHLEKGVCEFLIVFIILLLKGVKFS